MLSLLCEYFHEHTCLSVITIKIDMWKDIKDFFTMCSLFLEIEI